MNNLAILPYICLHALQIQNVKRDVVKKVSINELNNEIIHPVDQTDLNNTEDTSHYEHNHQEEITNNNTNTALSSTNIDDLPQPLSSGENIGAEI